MYLHSARVSLYVCSIPFLESLDQLNNTHSKRYHKTGPNRRYELTLTSPLPPTFQSALDEYQIVAPEEWTKRSVVVDGVELPEEEGGQEEDR